MAVTLVWQHTFKLRLDTHGKEDSETTLRGLVCQAHNEASINIIKAGPNTDPDILYLNPKNM